MLKTRLHLKGKFELGDRPTSEDFTDIFDSFLHMDDYTGFSISNTGQVTLSQYQGLNFITTEPNYLLSTDSIGELKRLSKYHYFPSTKFYNDVHFSYDGLGQNTFKMDLTHNMLQNANSRYGFSVTHNGSIIQSQLYNNCNSTIDLNVGDDLIIVIDFQSGNEASPTGYTYMNNANVIIPFYAMQLTHIDTNAFKLKLTNKDGAETFYDFNEMENSSYDSKTNYSYLKSDIINVSYLTKVEIIITNISGGTHTMRSPGLYSSRNNSIQDAPVLQKYTTQKLYKQWSWGNTEIDLTGLKSDSLTVNNNVRFSNYGIGNFTAGTDSYFATFDINGNVKESNVININNSYIGIGIDNPQHKLTILGTRILGTSTNLNNTNKSFRFGIGRYNNAETIPFDVFYGTCTSNSNQAFIGGGTILGHAATQINFYTATNNTTTQGTSRMRIDNAGNVSIGEHHPTAKLDVDGNIKTTSIQIEKTLSLSPTTISNSNVGDIFKNSENNDKLSYNDNGIIKVFAFL